MIGKEWTLEELFAVHNPLSAPCLSDIESTAKLKHYGRRQYVVRQGEVCRAFYFNRNGLLRIVHESEGTEDTIAIGEGGDVFTSLHSWWADEPGIFSLITVEESDLWVISYSDMRVLLERWPELWRWMCTLLTEQVYSFERRYLFFGKCDAEERYRNFMCRRPDTLRRLSVKFVAQYLKIAPETLSRIRARIVRGHAGRK